MIAREAQTEEVQMDKIQLQKVQSNKLQLEELFGSLDKLLQQGKNIVVAIEGSSASGKTTLGNILEQRYHCNVFHMDDFFLRPEQRTEERLKEPGGNVDRERFQEEVVIPLCKGEEIEYRRFDCSTFTLLPAQRILPAELTVVEGAYSMHPKLGKYYDLSVFLDISPEMQKERIMKRNTPEKAERFFKEWIPMEQNYFEVYNIKDNCELIIII